MAKNSFKTSFSKAEISREDDGRFIITERTKDFTSSYDLSEILEGLIGVDGIAMTISKDSEIEPLN